MRNLLLTLIISNKNTNQLKIEKNKLQNELCKKYLISPKTVRDIFNNKTWKMNIYDEILYKLFYKELEEYDPFNYVWYDDEYFFSNFKL